MQGVFGGKTVGSKTGFATGILEPGDDISMNSPLARKALGSGSPATEDGKGIDHVHLQEESNRYNMGHKQIKRLISKKDAAMKTMFACLVDIERKSASMKTEKGILPKSVAELLSSATRKRAKSIRTGDSFIKTLTAIYL